MTTNETTEANDPAVEQFETRDYVVDREDDSDLVVLARTGVAAAEHTVTQVQKTVAELNPEYPADDPVLFCAYEGELDDAFGEVWKAWPPSYLAFKAGDAGTPVYSFPKGRLQPAAAAELEEDDE